MKEVSPKFQSVRGRKSESAKFKQVHKRESETQTSIAQLERLLSLLKHSITLGAKAQRILVLGSNAVVKAAERGQLKFAFVSKDIPNEINTAIIRNLEVRTIPFVFIPKGKMVELNTLFGIKRAACFGCLLYASGDSVSIEDKKKMSEINALHGSLDALCEMISSLHTQIPEKS